MGSIEPYESAKGRRYRVRYRKPDHSQGAKRGFRTKRDAELYLASVELKKAAGDYIDSSSGRVTVGTLGTEWFATQTHLKPYGAAVTTITFPPGYTPNPQHTDAYGATTNVVCGGGNIATPDGSAQDTGGDVVAVITATRTS
ncbi:Arm DNA-binding domain-containing protein [Humibacter ginsengisoli]